MVVVVVVVVVAAVVVVAVVVVVVLWCLCLWLWRGRRWASESYDLERKNFSRPPLLWFSTAAACLPVPYSTRCAGFLLFSFNNKKCLAPPLILIYSSDLINEVLPIKNKKKPPYHSIKNYRKPKCR